MPNDALSITKFKYSIPTEFFWGAIEQSDTINRLRSTDHGPAHWARVARNGRRLASSTRDCDLLVVEFFALFHDSMRENEFYDPRHGARGARLAEELGIRHKLGDALFDTFVIACVGHDKGATTTDPTIGVCWDADRLDLPRVGITPDPEFLSTQAAKGEIA